MVVTFDLIFEAPTGYIYGIPPEEFMLQQAAAIDEAIQTAAIFGSVEKGVAVISLTTQNLPPSSPPALAATEGSDGSPDEAEDDDKKLEGSSDVIIIIAVSVVVSIVSIAVCACVFAFFYHKKTSRLSRALRRV